MQLYQAVNFIVNVTRVKSDSELPDVYFPRVGNSAILFALEDYNHRVMRGAHKIKTSDVRIVQKSIKQKLEKEVETLTQLMDLPDFDTSQFFQTLLKSQNHHEVLQRIPVEKKIYFFAKNYQAFLQTQQQMMNLELPKLQQIPKAKHFIFQQQAQQKVNENFEQSSVLEIIDSFSSFVLQKNVQQTLRVLQIIKQMKKSSKYKAYFDRYSLNKIFLETYNSFIDNCNNYQVLVKIGEYEKATEVYLGQKQRSILQQIKINLNLNDSPQSLGKQTLKLVEFIDKEVKIFRNVFRKEIDKNEDLITLSCDWIKKLTKNYYSLIESYIYQKDELSQILQSLNTILQKSTQLQSKGVCIERQLKQLIANDLPLHISKVIEIIVDSINQMLKQNNDLYEFTYFSSIKTFSLELSRLKPVAKDDYGVKCATCKGIILVNSFILILSTLCDQKWAFIHEGVLDILINKIALNILKCTLHYWDYYFIYIFFQRLAVGKVKHKQLFSPAEVHPGLNEKLIKIKKISQNSWRLCQSKITADFFKQILSNIPSQLYNFRRYGYSLQKSDLRPSTFSISLVFKFQQFFKQIQFRVNESQVKYLTMIFYEFILYTIEYVLFWSYHSKGTKDNVFTLHGKSEQLLRKVKQLNFLQIEEIKQKNILELSKLNKFGFLKLVFEIYFISDVIKYLTNYPKIDCEQFCIRLSKILAKDQSKELIDASRPQFQEGLTKMLKLFQERPQLMQNYLLQKKKES